MHLGYPEGSEGWLEQCDVCNQWVEIAKLLVQVSHRPKNAGSNDFAYWRYAAAGWSCTAVDEGAIAWADESFWIQVNKDNTTEQKGYQTWSGTGTFSADAAVDVSSWTTAVFRFQFGWHHTELNPGGTVAFGSKKGAGVNLLRTVTTKAGGRYGAQLTVSDIAAADQSAQTFYITVTPTTATAKWFITNLELIKNVTLPLDPLRAATLIKTTGSTVDRNYSTPLVGLKTCKDCRRPRPRVKRDVERVRDRYPHLRRDIGVD
jgi:hypothetical protein